MLFYVLCVRGRVRLYVCVRLFEYMMQLLGLPKQARMGMTTSTVTPVKTNTPARFGVMYVLVSVNMFWSASRSAYIDILT